MKEHLREKLTGVARRQAMADALRRLLAGVVWGAWLAVGMSLIGVETGGRLWVLSGWVVLLALPLGAAARAFLRPADMVRAARAVDDHFSLKDQTATAWQLAGREQLAPMDELQVQRAVRRLSSLDVGAVGSVLGGGRRFAGATVHLVVAVGLTLFCYSISEPRKLFQQERPTTENQSDPWGPPTPRAIESSQGVWSKPRTFPVGGIAHGEEQNLRAYFRRAPVASRDGLRE